MKINETLVQKFHMILRMTLKDQLCIELMILKLES